MPPDKNSPNSEAADAIIQHILDIAKGHCAITDETVMETEDDGMAEILSGLLILHETIQDQRDSLETARREVESHNEILEAKIQERTHELEAKSEHLRELNEELERASEMKSRFLANMSHELRTPLNSIIGFSTLGAKSKGGKIPEPARDKFQRIERNGRHLLGLINDILDLSKIESGTFAIETRELVLADILNDVVESIRPLAAARRAHIVFDPSATSPGHARGDERRVRQIILNLLSNAVKFVEDDRGVVEAELRTEDGMHVVCIRDNGIGIDAEHLERIFDPFTQVDDSIARSHQGTGLGLAISNRLALMMDGRLTVSSHIGKGSEFCFYLPRPPG